MSAVAVYLSKDLHSSVITEHFDAVTSQVVLRPPVLMQYQNKPAQSSFVHRGGLSCNSLVGGESIPLHKRGWITANLTYACSDYLPKLHSTSSYCVAGSSACFRKALSQIQGQCTQPKECHRSPMPCVSMVQLVLSVSERSRQAQF